MEIKLALLRALRRLSRDQWELLTIINENKLNNYGQNADDKLIYDIVQGIEDGFKRKDYTRSNRSN